MADDWAETDIPSQDGRVVLVTGANSGIGYETARALAQHRAHVVLACRSRPKADDAVGRILADAPSASVEVLDVDLADLESVRDAAARVSVAHDRLDVLVNNAGLMAVPEQRTVQGFEMQLGVNHLAHFALTGRLLPRLLATPGSRVVVVSSQAHRAGRFDVRDLRSGRRYHPWGAYCRSKLANLLYTFELDRRLRAAGAPTIAVAAHPGYARTNLDHERTGGFVDRIGQAARPVVERVFAQSAAMGALPTQRAATDPTARGGDYFGPSGLGGLRGAPTWVGCTRRARDEVAARRLWDASVALTGVGYAELGR